MTQRTLLRSISISPVDIAKGGLLLPLGARTVTVMPSGEVGKLDVVFEQQFELKEDTPK